MFKKILKESSENKSILNDTGYMAEYFWDKYGYDSEYQFFESDKYQTKLVFLKQRHQKSFTLVTVVPFRGKQKTNKWAKLATKEDKQKERILKKFETHQELIETLKTTPAATNPSVAVSADITQRLKRSVQMGEAQLQFKIDTLYSMWSTTLEQTVYQFWFDGLFELGVVSAKPLVSSLSQDISEQEAREILQSKALELDISVKVMLISHIREGRTNLIYLRKPYRLVCAKIDNQKYIFNYPPKAQPEDLDIFQINEISP